MGTPAAPWATRRADGVTRRSWYVEEAPAPAASALVACTWRGEPGWRRRIHLLPDACLDVAWDGTTVTVTTASAGPTAIALPDAGVTIGVRLRPEAAVVALGRPLPALAGPTPMRDLWPGDVVDELEDRLRRNPATAEAVLLDAVTSRRPHDGHEPDSLVVAFVHQLGDPRTTVERAARAIGASTRDLRRRVRNDTGLAPKALQDVLRFRRTLPLLAGATTVARAASDGGYADESHLCRHVRRLTHTTPARLARAQRQAAARMTP